MTLKFYLHRFIYVFFGTQFLIYLCWSFIELSFLTPIIDTFKTTNSRGCYLMIMFCILVCGSPYYAPFENNTKK